MTTKGETKFYYLRDALSALFGKACEASGLDTTSGQVIFSDRPDLGDFQCNGALAAAKQMKKNPRALAETILENLPENDLIASTELAGPGFINIKVTPQALAQQMAALRNHDDFGVTKHKAQKIFIDYGGMNAAKPMHVGHLRSSIIGQSLKMIFRALGHDVTGDIHLGDWGTQMGMLIIALRENHPDWPYFDENFTGAYPVESPITIDDLQEIYPKISARCKEDDAMAEAARQATKELQEGRRGYRALWQHFVDVSIADMKPNLEILGVNFEQWFGESHYQERMEKLVPRLAKEGHAIESRGALIIPVAEEGDKQDIPPLLLTKSDGSYLYASSDLATVEERAQDFAADVSFYVVDARQSLHFEQVFRAARKSGIAGKTHLEFLGFGTMNGKDGKPFKTRAGGVMRLEDLIQMLFAAATNRLKESGVAQDLSAEEQKDIAEKIGLAALKFADLQNDRMANYIFDLEKFMQFEGKTGPYLLYTAVRIASILRKAENGWQGAEILPPAGDAERELVLKLAGLDDALQLTAQKRAPHVLCDYVYQLAQSFSRFYNATHILSEENKAQQHSWLLLCDTTKQVLDFTLHLLGMNAPEKM